MRERTALERYGDVNNDEEREGKEVENPGVGTVHGTVHRVHVRGGVSRTTDEESMFVA